MGILAISIFWAALVGCLAKIESSPVSILNLYRFSYFKYYPNPSIVSNQSDKPEIWVKSFREYT